MILVGFLSWWYGPGWRDQFSRIIATISSINDQFSIPLLLKTFFKPFRQISSDEGGRSMQEKFQSMLDKLFSRIIGGFMRFFMIIFGFIAIIFTVFFGLIKLIIWPLFPLSPILGVMAVSVIGVPWTI